MNRIKSGSGFALFTVILLVAVISLISLAMVNVYLSNTRATSIDLQRIKADQLLDSGVRFAALSLASPRAKVSGSAIPAERLVYAAPDVDVVVEIQNEAGFIDLLSGDQVLIKAALLASGAVQSEVPELVSSIQLLVSQQREAKYRALRELLLATSIRTQELLSIATLHNGQEGVHPALAPEQVLALIPKLSKTQRDRILAQRNAKKLSLISNPINNDHFSSTVSAYYRVNSSVVLEGQLYSRVQIIKMINQRGQLYEVQATL